MTLISSSVPSSAYRLRPVATTTAPSTTVPATSPAPAAPLKVMTFNTAVGNPKITTNQADFVKLPFYQAVIQGKPDAPILCLQEVGNAQKAAVEKLAKNGNFTVRYMRTQTDQGNMILIPKRFQLEGYDADRFGFTQLQAAAKTVWNWIRGKEDGSLSKFTQLIELRGFQEMKLKDTVTGKAFTLFNTHLSFYGPVQLPQAKMLFDAAHEAAKRGPVIVAGDLNARTADTDPHTNGKDAQVRAYFKDFIDMGPSGNPPGKTNIDYVLAKGFVAESSKWYTGDSISLPGSPNAHTVSDHYAEENTLRFSS